MTNPEPVWLTDVTTIEALLRLPEDEHERWEVCSTSHGEWYPMSSWQKWSNETLVRVRRVACKVTIDADALTTLVEVTHASHVGGRCYAGCPTAAALAVARAALNEGVS